MTFLVRDILGAIVRARDDVDRIMGVRANAIPNAKRRKARLDIFRRHLDGGFIWRTGGASRNKKEYRKILATQIADFVEI